MTEAPQCNRMTVTEQNTDNKIIKIEQVNITIANFVDQTATVQRGETG